MEQHNILPNNFIFYARTIAKPINEIYSNGIERLSEDYIYWDKDCFWVLCDGAGGTGLLANDWAKYLAINLSRYKPRNTADLDILINKIWEEFYEYGKNKISDNFQLEKFESEGSSSTFVSCFLDTGNKFVISGYGDAMAFIYRENSGELEMITSLPDVDSFDLFPHLVNWQHLVHDNQGFFFKKDIVLGLKDIIIIASDSFSARIWTKYVATTKRNVDSFNNIKILELLENIQKENEDLNLFFKKLIWSLDDKKRFKKHCLEMVQKKSLWNDDCSVILICNHAT